MAERPTFEVGKSTYEMIGLDEAWTSDAPLVDRLTGLSWVEFVQRAIDLDVEDYDVEDVTVLHGMLGMSMAHANPTWSREKVVRAMSKVQIKTVEMTGGTDAGDVSPPVAAPTSSAESSPQPDTSRPDSDQGSNGSSRESSGALTSATSHEG